MAPGAANWPHWQGAPGSVVEIIPAAAAKAASLPSNSLPQCRTITLPYPLTDRVLSPPFIGDHELFLEEKRLTRTAKS
jgi:hypothetical protein